MWIYNNTELTAIPKDAVGFIYLITRINIDAYPEEPMYYIGKKHFHSKRKQKNSKRRKTVESDWQKYYGSSGVLKESIKKHSRDNFHREIIRICYSKSEMTYHEVMEQVNRRVLKYDKFSIMKKKYYNLNILGKFYKDTIFTNADKIRIKEYIETAVDEHTKVAVTNGTDTRYINTLIEDVPEWLSLNSEWRIGSTIHNTAGGKVWVTNDIISKPIFPDDMRLFLADNPSWRKGFQAIPRYCVVTDGEDNLHILCDTVDEFLSKNNDWYSGSKIKGKCVSVTNGETNKRIKKDQLLDFLSDNNTWREGGKCTVEKVNYVSLINLTQFKQMQIPEEYAPQYKDDGWEEANGRVISHYFKWVTKGTTNEKINPCKIDDYLTNGWKLGRYNNFNKGNVMMFKDGEYESVKNADIDKYLDNLWTLKGRPRGNRINVHNGITQRWFKTQDEVDTFLLKNPDYLLGQTPRKAFTTNGVVPCVNLLTNKKEMVKTSIYQDEKYKTYVSVNEFNSGKVTILFDSKEYTGYRTELIDNYGFPPSVFTLKDGEEFFRKRNTKYNGLTIKRNG